MQGPDEYWSERDRYINPATGILKNIHGLKTQTELDAFEEILFQANFPAAMARAFSCALFGLEDWRDIHRLCFADVYEWAGELRTVRISKGSTIFAYPEHTEGQADVLFGQLNEALAANSLTLDRAADFFGDMNILHPFREGNGRTQRILFAGILQRMGHDADYEGLTQEEMIGALVKAYKGEYAEVRALFRRIAGR